jgi:hypothetical protein
MGNEQLRRKKVLQKKLGVRSFPKKIRGARKRRQGLGFLPSALSADLVDSSRLTAAFAPGATSKAPVLDPLPQLSPSGDKHSVPFIKFLANSRLALERSIVAAETGSSEPVALDWHT